jgi:hypothetical protein
MVLANPTMAIPTVGASCMGLFVGLLAGFVARLCGVLRRYERLAAGHGPLGCWPTSLEDTWRRRPVRRK